MDELLQKLLEAEVLTEDTKAKLETAFQTQLDEAIQSAKDDAAADVRAELTEQWVNDRDALIEAVDTQVGDFIAAELDELKSDIDSFRDLEVEAADKLVEAKAAMAAELKNDLVELVESLDTFLEMRLTTELEELREDIMEVRKNEFGREIFEAFGNMFASTFADEDDTASTLAETKRRLADTQEALEEAEQKRASIERKVKMDETLSPLSGREREVMEAILKTVSTDKLDEGYNTFIGRVMKEAAEITPEKEEKVLAEAATVDDKTKKPLVEGTVITGDDEERLITESVSNDDSAARQARLAAVRKLAGL
jgi:hypothetical protein